MYLPEQKHLVLKHILPHWTLEDVQDEINLVQEQLKHPVQIEYMGLEEKLIILQERKELLHSLKLKRDE
jgi:hypothetical protein